MGIVLIAILLTAVLVLTGLFLLFRKYKPGTNPFRNPKYWGIAIITIPFLSIGFLLLWLFASSVYETQEFDKVKWNEDQHSRYVFVDDLIEGEKLIGLSRQEVIVMLGEAESEDDSTMTFYIGYTPWPPLNMDPDWLITDISNGKVSNVYIRK